MFPALVRTFLNFSLPLVESLRSEDGGGLGGLGSTFGAGLGGLRGLLSFDFHKLLLILEFTPDLLGYFAAPSRELTF